MDSRNKIIFLLLVLVQGLHSVEEYFGQLWNVFPPAKFLTGLISENPETGFLIINIGFFIFGIWCWIFPVRKNYSYAHGLIWFWIVIEIINGFGHSMWALFEGVYVPGAATAILLLLLSIYLSYHILYADSKSLKE